MSLVVYRFRVTNLLLMSLTPGFLSFITQGLLPIRENAIQISAAILILQILIASSVIDEYEFTIYYYSLVVMLLLAVVQFARLILARPENLPEQSLDEA